MPTKEKACKEIANLVERFQEQKESYRQSSYNETQTRRDFIDPFFKALGWDTDNEEGYTEAYREVLNEDKINRLVYELYKLTHKEIKIVEGS